MESAVVLVLSALGALVVGAVLGLVAFVRTRALRTSLARLEREIAGLRKSMNGPAGEEAVAPPSARHDTPSPTDSPALPQERDGAPDTDEAGGRDEAKRGQTERSYVDPQGAGQKGTGQEGERRGADVSAGAISMASAQARKTDRSFEIRFGANWTVWVGGLALVLGGIFLVRYSIETGLLTPLARVLAGCVLATALIGAGEALRRASGARWARPGRSGGGAYIPGVLTLAGITTAFGSVYAAYALYGLLGPAAAFVLLGAVAVATLVASLLHGPAVASVGLVAAFGVPLLVSSQDPALAAVAVYVLFVTFAAYAVARMRRWRWLAIAGGIGAIGWAHLLAAMADAGDAGLLALFIVLALAMAAGFFVVVFYPRAPHRAPARADWMVSLLLAAHALPTLYLLQIDGFAKLSIATLAIVLVTLVGLAIEWPAVAAAALTTIALGALAALSFQVPLAPGSFAPDIASDPAIAGALLNPSTAAFFRFAVAVAALLGIGGLIGAVRSVARWSLAWVATAGPLALFVVAYLRAEAPGLETVFGLTALAMAAGFAGATGYFEARLSRAAPSRDIAIAAYAIATIAALIAGLAILLQNGWLVIALALLSPAIAWVETKKPAGVLRWLAVAAAACCGLAVLVDPTIAGPALGRTPVFNWLLYGYGVPAVAFAATAWLMAFKTRDLPQQIFEAAAIVFSLATLAMLIHHAMNNGVIFSRADTLGERSLYTLLALSASIALQKLHGRAGGAVFDAASLVLGLASFLAIAVVHFVALNPLISGEPIGTNAVFNLLLPAYLLPGVLAGVAAWLSAGKRAPIYTAVAGLLALTLTFAWASLEVRALFHRPRLQQAGAMGDSELYAYSLVWLAFAIALLVAGIASGMRVLRLASGAVLALVVVKVFLIDMSSLTGIWRALSFIGLGFVLIGIGAVYQWLSRHDETRTQTTTPD